MTTPNSQVNTTSSPPKRNALWWILGIIVVVLLICCVVGVIVGGIFYYYYASSHKGTTEIIPPSVITLPAIMVSPTSPPPSTEIIQPEATQLSATLPAPATSPALEPTPNVIVNNISFSYSPQLAQSVDAETVQESLSDQSDGMPGEIYPKHTKFTFNGYPLSGTFHSPYILVYPAKEYTQMDPAAATVINDLTQLLVQKPANPERMPFLPLWNAGQMFHSNIEYLSFKNGSGVRYLTMYAQAYYPVNNNSLFYTFQGLTHDGNYYIASVFPVSHPSLPDTGDEIPDMDFDAFVENFDNYIAETAANLEAQPLASFTPDISLLDDLFESFNITP